MSQRLGELGLGLEQQLHMHFFSFFKTLVGKPVTLELKNGLKLQGQLHSVDQFLNLKLQDISVQDAALYPHLFGLSTCFVRGSVVRYVHLDPQDVDTQLLQDATRRASRQ